MLQMKQLRRELLEGKRKIAVWGSIMAKQVTASTSYLMAKACTVFASDGNEI